MLGADGDESPRPDERFFVTLSGRDGRLLYRNNKNPRSSAGSTWAQARTDKVILLDADKEYEAGAPGFAAIYADGPRDGAPYRDENVDRLAYCPLVGVALPGMDLIQSPVYIGSDDGRVRFTGLVPRLNIVGESPYKAGEIQASLFQGRLRVLSLVIGTGDAPEQKWDVSAFRLLQGHWVGSRMRLASYYPYSSVPGREPVSKVAFISNYELVRVRNAALETRAFDIGTYLVPGARVVDIDGQPFRYDPRAGSLQEQADQARAVRQGEHG